MKRQMSNPVIISIMTRIKEIGCKFLHNVAKNREFGIKCSSRICSCRREETGSTKNDTDSEKKIDNTENYVSEEEFITNKSAVTSTQTA